MSMELMVLAMKVKVGNPLRKLVLIKLADNASDSGECWPSYQYIAEQCEIGNSTVRKHIKDLADDGLLTIKARKGPKGNDSNVYKLHLREGERKPSKYEPLQQSENPSLTLKQAAKPNNSGVLPDSIGGCQQIADPMSPDSIGGCQQVADPMPPDSTESVIKPVIKSSKKTIQKNALDFSAWPAMPSEQTLADWLAMRKRQRADVSQTVINRLAPQLHLAVGAGFSVDDCLAECVTRNWRGFNAVWLGNAGVNPSHIPVVTEDWTRHVFDPEDPLV
ncbi:helix-turn-helix domain-containing protein [Shewanella xiamenensis]|uniref:helix-turn-helix domain-containing protein n=1 Tax=Shewanella xiamenensis TaxID=332186 RepID=UPI00313B2410